MISNQYSHKPPKIYVVAVSVLLVFLVGTLDALTGKEVSLSIFYLLPVAWVAWQGSRQLSILMAFLCALTGLAAALLGGAPSQVLIPYWNMLARLSVYLINAFLISELKARLEYEAGLSQTDPLTQAANRRSFYSLAQLEIERGRRHRRPLTIAYIDLDDFKSVNDRFGHQTGDALLCQVASIIQRNIRKNDGFARLGGDEFVILLPEIDKHAAQQALNKVRTLLLAAMLEKGWPVTFTIGAVTLPSPARFRRRDDPKSRHSHVLR